MVLLWLPPSLYSEFVRRACGELVVTTRYADYLPRHPILAVPEALARMIGIHLTGDSRLPVSLRTRNRPLRADGWVVLRMVE